MAVVMEALEAMVPTVVMERMVKLNKSPPFIYLCNL